MAKVFKSQVKAPVFPQPFDLEQYRKNEREYVEKVRKEVMMYSPNDPLAGEIIRFPMADSYAEYMVARSKPLQLIHMEVGDRWCIPDAHMRGLKLSDINGMVERERMMRNLFDKKT